MCDCGHGCELTYSDLHKDVYGFRPRGEMPADLCAEYDRLVVRLEEVMVEEAAAETAALERFEQRVMSGCLQHGVGKRVYIRWLMQAENISLQDHQDVEMFFWSQGMAPEHYRAYTALMTK